MSPSIRDGLPNIYTGVLTFALIPLYIAAKHIRLGEKLLHLGLLVFMFISFNLNGLDFIWHGMHYPNQLPYRYSFVYSFLVLIICFRVLTQVRTFTPRAIATAFGGGILYAILAEVISPDLVEHTAAYIAIILLIVYMLITLSLVRRVETLRMTALLLSILCIAELCVKKILTIYTINENEYYTRGKTLIMIFRRCVSASRNWKKKIRLSGAWRRCSRKQRIVLPYIIIEASLYFPQLAMSARLS